MTQTSLEVSRGQVEGTAACAKAQRAESRWCFPGTVGASGANWMAGRPRLEVGAGLERCEPGS